MSWASSEIYQCSFNPTCATLGVDAKGYVQRVNIEFMKIGALGITLLASSGDRGAQGNVNCFTSNNTDPQFPASSPFVSPL